jgi:hypothetical protein
MGFKTAKNSKVRLWTVDNGWWGGGRDEEVWKWVAIIIGNPLLDIKNAFSTLKTVFFNYFKNYCEKKPCSNMHVSHGMVTIRFIYKVFTLLYSLLF